ncbi:2Fe-2S iron-sulfur cluster-binding protein [Natronococcus sp. A-GB7]|uniref:2Fe-2S iron-sulfur cluster-binding protein n=1 Tax=Natronococcus sp. A-GB7 TaxID=3037649 RepID=UPI00241DC906|nr:2Fe-2S iron-sulfur cluster-binding protein [Natronococcus sp. A-GB7]MDG5819197.1 2Fe-2S iron-sulfur cluster-binding protein [Natronococcus sp. A-GB7]
MTDSPPSSARATTSSCPAKTRFGLERRHVLLAAGTAGAAALGGCLDDETDDEEAAAHDVTFLENGAETEVTVEETEELLYPALEADVEIPYSCEAGTCGQCTARYDGDATDVVAHDGNDYLEEDQIADGWVLTCVAYPRDSAELEVAHPDDA